MPHNRKSAHRATVADQIWLIESIKRNRHGQRERVQFLGAARTKPKGWRLVRYLGPAMAAQNGTI